MSVVIFLADLFKGLHNMKGFKICAVAPTSCKGNSKPHI